MSNAIIIKYMILFHKEKQICINYWNFNFIIRICIHIFRYLFSDQNRCLYICIYLIRLYICMQACEASQQADYESTDDIAYPLETEMLAMARAVEEGEVSTV